MPQETIDASSFSPDVVEFLQHLEDHAVRYVIVGGEAVIFYGHVRLTGDIDFFYDSSADNADRPFKALEEFWEGSVPGLDGPSDLVEPGQVVQFGVPPNRIDLLNEIEGVDFETGWHNRTVVDVETPTDLIAVNYIGLEQLILNKTVAARPKDLDDLPYLNRALDQVRRNR